MSKVLFIGDVHLSPRTPASRRDNYSQTMLNKLLNLLPIIKQHDVKHLIFLGDVFNTVHMTLPYFIKCFSVFKQLNTQCSLHLVIGNHDIYYNSDSTMDESPIQILLDSELFNNKTFTIDTTTISLFNYTTTTDELPAAPQDDNYHILVGHYFYNLGFNDTLHTISKEQATSLGYNAYVLGHDHTPYDPVHQKSYDVHRPGSLSRGTSATSQINRDSIQVLLFDPKKHTFDYIDLPEVQPISEVFKELSLISKVDFTDIDIPLQDLLKSFEFDNSSDVFEALSTLDIPSDVKELVLKYLSDEGIYDTGGDNDDIE